MPVYMAPGSNWLADWCDNFSVGLTNYFNHCKALGLGSKASYTLYLTGRAPDSSAISMREYRERGTTLEALRREWLTTWYQS